MAQRYSEPSSHLIFGQNLRILCKERGTLAKSADDLGISRVQMNRILNGESFPKPGLLKRVCEVFDVDSRILLEPIRKLRDEQASQPDTWHLATICDFESFGGNSFWGEGSQDSLPDGIHLMSRANDTERDLFSTGLVRVKTLNGQRFIRGFQPPGAGLERSNVTPIYSREFRALGLNAQNGLSFVYTSARLGLFYGMAHFSMIESLCLGFYPGCRLIFSEMGNHNRYITPTLLDPLSQKTSTILEAARQTGTGSLVNLPQRYQTLFAQHKLTRALCQEIYAKERAG